MGSIVNVGDAVSCFAKDEDQDLRRQQHTNNESNEAALSLHQAFKQKRRGVREREAIERQSEPFGVNQTGRGETRLIERRRPGCARHHLALRASGPCSARLGSTAGPEESCSIRLVGHECAFLDVSFLPVVFDPCVSQSPMSWLMFGLFLLGMSALAHQVDDSFVYVRAHLFGTRQCRFPCSRVHSQATCDGQGQSIMSGGSVGRHGCCNGLVIVLQCCSLLVDASEDVHAHHM